MSDGLITARISSDLADDLVPLEVPTAGGRLTATERGLDSLGITQQVDAESPQCR
ncbi:hypothetical protein [Natronorubrum texcoconense]|uniref:hypothetical protein n=1 Tax=Natronorubrum texcoconense TaxID=1095776 RepID=UPI0015871DAB|nr:hypothetical protein [Natronorubrum texcoconense]